jgi:hypothetical protein
MATPAPGTIPALPQYQPGALPLTGGEILEIASSATATAAISAYMPLTDVVGKTPSVLPAAVPTVSDLIAFFQVGSGLPKQTAVGNLQQSAGNLPIAGNTGQILAKNSANNYDDSWYNLSTFIIGTAVVSGAQPLSVTGSTTVSIAIATNGILGQMIATNTIGAARISQRSPLSVFGNATNATATIADIIASTGNQVLQTDSTGTTLLWTTINLATSIVTGVLPGANMSAVNLAAAGAGGVQGVLPLANGGLGTTSFTPFGVMLGNGTAGLGITAAGTVGLVLVAAGTLVAPSFNVVGIAGGGTGTTNLAAHGVVVGSGSTLAAQVAGAVAPGNLLIDQGTATNPAFTAMGGAGAISSTGFFTLNNFASLASAFGVVSTTTMTAIANMSCTIVTGGVYSIEASLFATAGGSGGTQITLACSTAVSNIVYQINAYAGSTLVNGNQYSALLQALPATTAVNPSFQLFGTVIAGNQGVLSAQVAQVASTTTTTNVLKGSMFRVLRIA